MIGKNKAIKSLRLKNILSFGAENDTEGVYLPCESLNVFIGQNGSGKSNLLDVLDILSWTTRDYTIPIRSNGVSEWLYKGNTDSSNKMCIDVEFLLDQVEEVRDKPLLYSIGIENNNDYPKIYSESLKSKEPLMTMKQDKRYILISQTEILRFSGKIPN
jgi:AAA15 family ATPase/GTPase